MSNETHTTRRSFLKSGALVAAPIAAVAVPAAALAGDGSHARLARLEDERAIEALNRDFLRRFNQGGASQTGELFARGKAPGLPQGVARLSLTGDGLSDGIELSADGTRASCRYACGVQTERPLEGNETIVQMARFQGNYVERAEHGGTLHADYVKLAKGWAIEKLHLA